MNNEFLTSLYTFDEQMVTKAYKNTIDNYIKEFETKDISEVYKIFLIVNNKKYSLGKYKALQIASFEYLYYNENLINVELIKYETVNTPDGEQYFPPIYNKNLIVRNSLLLKKQKELLRKK
ncbi:MAG: hypothetical protein ACI4TX_03170 [Christensenellales bacterium]